METPAKPVQKILYTRRGAAELLSLRVRTLGLLIARSLLAPGRERTVGFVPFAEQEIREEMASELEASAASRAEEDTCSRSDTAGRGNAPGILGTIRRDMALARLRAAARSATRSSRSTRP